MRAGTRTTARCLRFDVEAGLPDLYARSGMTRTGSRVALKQRFALGFALSSAIAGLAYHRRMLTRDGIIGTILVGTLVYTGEGLAGSSVVIFFFASSSLLSQLSSDRKQSAAADKFGNSSTRNLWQTVANGGVGAVAALGHLLHPRHPNWLLAAFVGAFASATADTWATELGTLSAVPPRLITTGRHVALGTSGGITAVGTTAATVGALALSAVAALVMGGALHHAEERAWLVVSGLVGGVAGALVDSLLGATVQHIRYCPVCHSETEQLIHRCGSPTIPRSGVTWLDNDVVNLLCTAVGAVVAAGSATIGRRALKVPADSGSVT